MVQSIKNINSRPELHVKKDKPVATAVSESNQSTAKNLASVDTVEVGSNAGIAAVRELAKAPHIDMEAVNRIKEAISQGEYPVDIERVTEALMDAYIELKS
tara:strand:+ start:123 stop:425 length:303 start_codon:yes stop_codon:yes gene_type:complete